MSLLVWVLYCGSVLQGQPRTSGYHILDSVRLGGEGGWDYLTVDTSAERLYISRASRVQVVDMQKRALIGEIPHTPGVHGIALVHSKGRGYTSNGRDSTVTVFDLETLKTLSTIRVDGRNPDAILFDQNSGRLFTFNGGSANATAIDVTSEEIVGAVPLDGKPEFAVADGRGRIYVNIEDRNDLVVFDAKTLQVLKRWSLAPGEAPTGLAIDREHRRLFAGCGNRLMVILDADSGNVVATLPIGEGVDGTAYDPDTRLAFSANGEGTLTVVREDTPTRFSSLGNVATRRGARTLVVDEKTHRIYTVTARFGPPPPPTPERPRPRPSIEPGTATLYVLGR
jgi:DNA-binding beta-propeller fold protein YncE